MVSAAPALSSEPPRVVGDYLLKRRLGSGAMGEVWLGWHRFSESLAAVKLLSGTRELSGRLRRALDRERRAIGRLAHPNIVSLYDVGPHYIVMEYIDGPNLSQRLATPLEPARAISIVLQIASALAHAHAAGVVHRDVKPSNILIDSHGNAFLTDFGLATLAGESLESRSLRAGTPGYMPPEQRRGMIATPAADQYALARSLLEMLVGCSPADDDSEALRELPPALPPELERMIARALAHEPSERFASVEDFASALARIDLQGLAAPVRLAPEVRIKTPFAWCRAAQATHEVSPDIARADYSLKALAESGALPAGALEQFRQRTGYEDFGWSMYAHQNRLGPISDSGVLARASDIVVLGHGLLCTRRVWRVLAQRVCRENAQAVVLVPDLFGFGESRFCPHHFRPEHASPAALALAVLEWLELLGVRELPTVLLGHSAAAAALLSVSDEMLGERTTRIALTPVFPRFDPPLAKKLALALVLLRTFCRAEPLRRLLGRLLLYSADTRRHAPEERRQIYRRFLEIRPEMLAEIIASIARALPHPQDRLDRCVIVVGKDDPLAPEAQILAMLDRLGFSGRNLQRMASGGHMPHAESDEHPEWTLRNVDHLARIVESMLLSAREGTPDSTRVASTVLASTDVA